MSDTTSMSDSTSETGQRVTLSSLRRWNIVMAVLHFAQAAAMLALTKARSLPVTAVYGTGPPGQPERAPEITTLFSYNLGWAVASFMLLSSLFHALVASPWGYPRYCTEIRNLRNRFRWVEYSLSASLMIVLIAGIVGITDVAALIALFAVNASMILFGWLMETGSRPSTDAVWTPFIFGCLAGVAPWVAITVYLFGTDGVPGFVYGIFVSLFVFFNCFAINQWLQYRAKGRWADYRYGERVYMILSVVAKSLLAWQIFTNVLI